MSSCSGARVSLPFHALDRPAPRFCRQQNFTDAQTSVVLGILMKTLVVDAETWSTTCSDSYGYVAEMLLQHAVDRSPTSVLLFSPEDVQAVQEFLLQQYFAHFSLYKATLARRPTLNLQQVESEGVIAPTPLEPLAAAIPMGELVLKMGAVVEEEGKDA